MSRYLIHILDYFNGEPHFELVDAIELTGTRDPSPELLVFQYDLQRTPVERPSDYNPPRWSYRKVTPDRGEVYCWVSREVGPGHYTCCGAVARFVLREFKEGLLGIMGKL